MSDLFTTPSTGAPKFPPKPMIPTKTSSVSSGTSGQKPFTPASNFGKEDSKMQIVGIALVVLGIILLAAGILTWK